MNPLREKVLVEGTTMDIEMITKLARHARIDCLNADREEVKKHILKDKRLDDFLRSVDGWLEVEMDGAGADRLSAWKLRTPLRSLLGFTNTLVVLS